MWCVDALFMEISLASICVEKQFNRSRLCLFWRNQFDGMRYHRMLDPVRSSWNFILRREISRLKLHGVKGRNDIFSLFEIVIGLRRVGDNLSRVFFHGDYVYPLLA